MTQRRRKLARSDPSFGQRALIEALNAGPEAISKLPEKGRVVVRDLIFAPLVHPGRFGLVITGGCLEPYFMDGDIAIVDPDKSPEGGRLAAFFTNSGDGSIKILLEVMLDAYRVARTNPKEQVLMPLSAIAKAMRVLGVTSPDGLERTKYPKLGATTPLRQAVR